MGACNQHDVLEPTETIKTIKFNACVAAVLYSSNIENKYELIFIYGSPGKCVYIGEEYVDNICIGGYYTFECIVDNNQRCWYRVIDISEIESDSESELMNDAKIVRDRYKEQNQDND